MNAGISVKEELGTAVDGFSVGKNAEVHVGTPVGGELGIDDGTAVGTDEGINVGVDEGIELGDWDEMPAATEGAQDLIIVGIVVGIELGTLEGTAVGIEDGTDVGTPVRLDDDPPDKLGVSLKGAVLLL